MHPLHIPDRSLSLFFASSRQFPPHKNRHQYLCDPVPTMRRSLLVLTASLLVASAAATQLPLPGPSKNSTSKPMSDPSFPQPGSIPAADRLLGSSNSEMSLADALTLERKAGVWWDYARDVSSVVRLNVFSSFLYVGIGADVVM